MIRLRPFFQKHYFKDISLLSCVLLVNCFQSVHPQHYIHHHHRRQTPGLPTTSCCDQIPLTDDLYGTV